VLARHAKAEEVKVLLDDLPVLEKNSRPLDGRGVPPGGKCGRGGLHRGIHLGRPPAGHSAITSPVEGLNTGVPGIFGSIHSPLMKSGQGVWTVETAMVG